MLKGMSAVITGASSGIGRAITMFLANEGASLYLIGRDMNKLNQLSESLSKKVEVKVFKTDLSRDEDIGNLTLELLKNIDSLDILIHSAGYFAMGNFEDLSVDDFDRLFRVNVRAPFLITKKLLPLIKKSRGQVVFINSSAGLQARAKVSQYAASKHALKAIADSLREEVNADGIRVISVYPGRTATPMQEEVHRIEGKAYKPELLMQPEDVAQAVLNALKLHRTAEVTDLLIRPMKKI